LSLRSHPYRERHFDEVFIFIYGFQGDAHVIGDVDRSALLDPIRKLLDGGKGILGSSLSSSSKIEKMTFLCPSQPRATIGRCKLRGYKQPRSASISATGAHSLL
jgi:hypothetical protein